MTKREQYVRNAAQWLVDGINSDRLQSADCTIDEIANSLSAPFFESLSLSTQYPIAHLSEGQRRALAKNIASAVANHPSLDLAKVARIYSPK